MDVTCYQVLPKINFITGAINDFPDIDDNSWLWAFMIFLIQILMPFIQETLIQVSKGTLIFFVS